MEKRLKCVVASQNPAIVISNSNPYINGQVVLVRNKMLYFRYNGTNIVLGPTQSGTNNDKE